MNLFFLYILTVQMTGHNNFDILKITEHSSIIMVKMVRMVRGDIVSVSVLVQN